jgi:hypothetical protein
VVEDLAQIGRLVSLVPAMREPGTTRAVVVFPGPRGDLGRLDGIEARVVCLDAPARPADAREIGARYLALVARERPAAVVVVGGGSAAAGCADAARACGIDVVQFDAPAPGRRRVHATSGNGGVRRPAAGRNGGAPGAVDLGIRVIPALQPWRARPSAHGEAPR